MWMNIVLGLIALLTFAYFWTTRNYGYFSSRGVFEMPASFPFGTFNSWNLFTQKKSFLNGLDDVYNKYKQHKLVGSFSLSMPLLIINDMEIIKNVLIKDWDHFVDRRVMSSNPRTKAAKMFSQMLTVLKGDKWKKMRSTLSPVFTSGKLKSMTSFINKVSLLTCDLLKLINSTLYFRSEKILLFAWINTVIMVKNFWGKKWWHHIHWTQSPNVD